MNKVFIEINVLLEMCENGRVYNKQYHRRGWLGGWSGDKSSSWVPSFPCISARLAQAKNLLFSKLLASSVHKIYVVNFAH